MHLSRFRWLELDGKHLVVVIDSILNPPHPLRVFFISFKYTNSVMAARTKLNVQNFPRPPLLQQIPRHIVIKWGDQTLADTRSSYWVLETTHPPSKYLGDMKSPEIYISPETNKDQESRLLAAAGGPEMDLILKDGPSATYHLPT